MVTDSIGRYRNLKRIGRGGMGEIFRAEDPSLQRMVALKFISPDCVADASARLRLIREARAAASISHPFVCTVHEVLDDGDQPVIVMEFVSGETLHDRLTRGPLPPDEIVTVGGEILEAIAAAHDLGIIHRDIKSANVMLTPSGHVKVMDFGLAMSSSPVSDTSRTVEQLTAKGAIVGTVTHMAPELLLGSEATVATDLYAFGVTLYEMCAGRLPFSGATSAAIAAEVLAGSEASPRHYNPAIPQALDALVMTLIDRDPARRPHDARVARDMLERAFDASLAVSGVQRSVAVLPFRAIVADAETEMLGIALADATISELSLLRSLTVRPTAAILRYKDAIEPAKAGRELAVDAVVHGTFQRSGARLRVTAQLIKTAEARAIWATKIDTSLDDIFATQDEVSRRIAEALDIQLSPADEQRLSRVAQPAGAAYEAYVGGFVHLMRETLPDTHAAIDAFRKAVEIDPRFALGWASLAEAYTILGYAFDPDPQWFSRAAELTARAIAIDPKLPEARYLQGRLNWNPASGWDHVQAIRHFAAAIAGNPNLAQAHVWLAIVLVHVGLLEESLMHVRRAIDIVPDNWNAKVMLSWFLLLDGRSDEALELATEFARRFPGHEAYYSIANIHLREPRLDLAEEVARRATREFPNDVYFHPVLAIIAAMRRDPAGLQASVEATLANSQAFGHFHHAQYDIACAYAIAGNAAEAVRWLTDSARNGNPCAAMIERDPLLASIRDSDELRPLLGELHEQQGRYAIAYRDAMTRPFTESNPHHERR